MDSAHFPPFPKDIDTKGKIIVLVDDNRSAFAYLSVKLCSINLRKNWSPYFISYNQMY